MIPTIVVDVSKTLWSSLDRKKNTNKDIQPVALDTKFSYYQNYKCKLNITDLYSNNLHNNTFYY